MKKFFSAGLFAIVLMAAANQVTAQSKYGYISTQELISVMPDAAKADTTLSQLREALVQNLRDKETTFQSSLDKFYKDSVTLSAAVKEVRRTELQKIYQDLAGEEQRIQQQLQERQQGLMGPIYKKAMDAIQAVAKENGYGYIFERESVLVAPPADNVLPLVAKKLNIKLPANASSNQPAGTPPAAAPKN
ncbi:MAG: OmpH family outer membrane protein [Chitinophagaceae bacterium]|nr:MAG: OmpH family outer membrane protein [Chitinophagaceae bacterium]